MRNIPGKAAELSLHITEHIGGFRCVPGNIAETGGHLGNQRLILAQVPHHTGLYLIHAFQAVDTQGQIILTEISVFDRKIIRIIITERLAFSDSE